MKESIGLLGNKTLNLNVNYFGNLVTKVGTIEIFWASHVIKIWMYLSSNTWLARFLKIKVLIDFDAISEPSYQ